MIRRPGELARVRALLKQAPVVALLGARQVGKTTLARALAGDRGAAWYDLESSRDAGRLADPEWELGRRRGLVVLDEIQHQPALFKALRVLADRPGVPARFLVLGSAAPALLRQASESLAGRVLYHELPPLRREEAGPRRARALWLRGGFPRSLLAATDAASLLWRRTLIEDYARRDLPELGLVLPSGSVHRFWAMLAHYHGQVLNLSELARSFGMSDASVRRYTEILQAAFMLRLLPPWHENLGKRQVKAPKAYLRDTGILHALLGIPDRESLEAHPKRGASWEGMALFHVLETLRPDSSEAYFWATHQGAELDLLLVRGRNRLGFEFKLNAAPSLTPSMRHAMADLKLDHLWVVHPGEERYPLAPRVTALPFRDLSSIR